MPVTIGIPFLNPGAAFDKAVRSVFAQTLSDWELLLVDDGSRDGSTERARAIDDPRVKVISDGRNRGLCARLNEIAALASRPLLCRMDSDDVMHPDRVRRQVEWMTEEPSLDVLGTRAIGIDEADRPVCMLGRAFDDEDPEREALGRSLFVHSSVIGRRDWFRANSYDPEYVRAEDHELWLRSARASRYAFRPEPLTFYRQPAKLALSAYVATCRTDRRILRRYGPRVAGVARTAALLARSLAFESVHRAASAAHATAALMRLRGGPLPPGAVRGYEAAIARAVGAAVPGWPPAAAEGMAGAGDRA